MSTNTRERVLRTLLLNQRRTVNELAEAVDINPISVRHHVIKLEAEGLIQSEEERHGVGRPHFVYSLTNKGMEQFPQRYLQLTLRLLQHLKTNLSEKVIGEIFQELAEGIAGELTQDVDLEDLTLHERLQLLQEVLTSEGFMVNLQEEEDNFYIIEASCPYHHVGEDHPEICVVDRELIAHFVSSTPQRIECILDGDKQCKYLIKKTVEIE
ncbi:MAG: winged helix-turn-helix transcriptional regulator [Anaerolineales bacterium]|nr:winged helix-turn-helix transcriptional regulator [Anaerolineales bacterium]